MNSWLLHHDNAPNGNFLQNINVLEQPLYSPDLAPCDFFLFSKLKGVIKGTRFQDTIAITTAATKELRTILVESFQECLEAWQRRMEKWIRASSRLLRDKLQFLHGI